MSFSWFAGASAEAEAGLPDGAPLDIFGADLVHWYRDGWDGSQAVDLINSANNMTAASGRAPTTGTVNGHDTASFPGVDEVIASSDVSTVAGASELTIFGCFNAPGTQTNVFATIIGKLFGGVEFHVGGSFGGSRLIASVGSDFGLGSEATSDANPFDGTWHRFIFTWVGGGTGTLYIDGVAQTATTAVTDATVPNASEYMSMGGVTDDNATNFDYFFNGDIANVGIAIRAATSGEIADLDAYLESWVGASALSDMTSVPANGVATTTAILRGTGNLTSTAAAGVATTTGVLRGTGNLTSTAAAGVATTTATIQGLADLTSVAANGVATTTASIGAVANLTSVAAAGVATTTAAIVGTGRLTSTAAAGVATTTASIGGTGTLTSTAAAGVATTTAAIQGLANLTSVAAAGVATTSGNIGATANVSGSAAGVATTTATIIASYTLVVIEHESAVHAGVQASAAVRSGVTEGAVVRLLPAMGAVVRAGWSGDAEVRSGVSATARVEAA